MIDKMKGMSSELLSDEFKIVLCFSFIIQKLDIFMKNDNWLAKYLMANYLSDN